MHHLQSTRCTLCIRLNDGITLRVSRSPLYQASRLVNSRRGIHVVKASLHVCRHAPTQYLRWTITLRATLVPAADERITDSYSLITWAGALTTNVARTHHISQPRWTDRPLNMYMIVSLGGLCLMLSALTHVCATDTTTTAAASLFRQLQQTGLTDAQKLTILREALPKAAAQARVVVSMANALLAELQAGHDVAAQESTNLRNDVEIANFILTTAKDTARELNLPRTLKMLKSADDLVQSLVNIVGPSGGFVLETTVTKIATDAGGTAEEYDKSLDVLNDESPLPGN